MDLEIRLLRYFVATAEERCFTRAAHRLNMTQQSLSSAVSQLESALGAKLFERTRRQVALTPAGEVLLEHAYAILTAAQRASTDVRAAAGQVGGTLAISTTEDIDYLTMPLLAAYADQHPRVSVRVTVNVDNARALEDICAGRVETGISHCLGSDAPDLESAVLGWEDVVVAVPQTSPLADQAVIDRSQLAGLTVLLFARQLAPALWDLLVRELGVSNGGREVRQIRSGQAAMLAAAAQEDGITVVTPRVFRRERHDGLVARSLAPALRVPVHVVWRPPASAQLRALLEVLKATRGTAADVTDGVALSEAHEDGAVPGRVRTADAGGARH